MHTISYPLSVFPEVMSVQFSASEIYYTVVLKDSQQLVSATQKQNMPIICWNPFILLPHLQTDLEQRHLVQMNEPVSLNNSFSSFFSLPYREFGVGRGAESSHCFICFQFWELKCKTCSIWWLLVLKVAQQEQQHNVKTKLEEEEKRIYLALVESFMFLLLWQKAVN